MPVRAETKPVALPVIDAETAVAQEPAQEPESQVELQSQPAPSPELQPEPEQEPEPEPEPETETEPDPSPELQPEPEPEPENTPLSVIPEIPEIHETAKPAVPVAGEPIALLVNPGERDRREATSRGAAASVPLDNEDTRIVSRDQSGERFILQFSTGETHTITGTGLIGRNPQQEPGEYFDHRIVIVDQSKSVSKTHLEFGQTAGVLWVSDRYSGNGTVIKRPQSDPQRAEPGKRYLVSRGSRVEIGDQFLIVS
ncbi:MAG: FHA domain-containing protein [Microbacteriaceae bacterium]